MRGVDQETFDMLKRIAVTSSGPCFFSKLPVVVAEAAQQQGPGLASLCQSWLTWVYIDRIMDGLLLLLTGVIHKVDGCSGPHWVARNRLLHASLCLSTISRIFFLKMRLDPDQQLIDEQKVDAIIMGVVRQVADRPVQKCNHTNSFISWQSRYVTVIRT